MNIRRPAVAGRSYPGNPTSLAVAKRHAPLRDKTPQDLPTASPVVATGAIFAGLLGDSADRLPHRPITSWNGWRRVRLAQILDLFAEDDRLNVYAGELEVRPPDAPTIQG
jgi:hypothetical protein